ncbi:adenylate/guanylate cyclase domain-containing protein [Azospirillum sp. YIM B02556]|uniref:Adenylate/guanylate cyclase domain-containing protein n=1 Tax=Azospirillum endophyticum TaxID=2800326 RepID=A0ABS1F506_9PROT|nr:adenylate/guanylate cyclase domain-containing protein [Azospirillum endophyticum]MBK1838509.1 adenylate/guanylate cyclase domain-containing protein [Azospirillum endophyticum]
MDGPPVRPGEGPLVPPIAKPVAPLPPASGRRGWPETRLTIGIVLGSMLMALAATRMLPPLRTADESLGDRLIAASTPARPQHPGIALVLFGEDSFTGLACRSPVDRGMLANIIDVLAAAGVRAIGIDVLFDQPTLPALDERLRRALLGAPVPVVAITALDQTPLTERQRRFLDEFTAGMPRGHANLAKDRLDAAVRWHVPFGGDGTPSLPVRLALLGGVAQVPAEPFRIDWRGRPDGATAPFPVYPAEAVAVLPKSWLAGRIVLVGTVLAGIDQHRTPLSTAGASTPGVEIEAHVLAQLLDGRRDPRLPVAGEAVLALLMAVAGVAVAAAAPPLWLLAAAGLLVPAAAWAGSAALFAAGGPLVPLVAPALAWGAGIAAMTVQMSLRERADRRVMMQLFANHVSQPVAEEIWRERATFMAGGRPRPQQLTATVLFSDIEGFTTICEALEPEPLIRWLEGYLDAMVRIVTANDGVVLRFVGDAILAVFGAPVARTTQAQIDADACRAVRCALEMGRDLVELNRRWQAEGLPPVGIRVGVHTGPLVAGSLGGLRHSEYSLLGDTANTAARLEAYGKMVDARTSRHCRVIVGDPTWQSVGQSVEQSARRAVPPLCTALPVGEVALKGKLRAVRVWLLVDDDGDDIDQ